MGIRTTYKKLATKVSQLVDIVDYYLDKGYGYIYDAILLLFVVSIFAYPFVGVVGEQDLQRWYLLGIYVLFAYFISDHIITNKFGTERKRHQQRQKPGDQDEQP